MALRLSKGPNYDHSARRNALSTAFGGALVLLGIVASSASAFSALVRTFDLALPVFALQFLQHYRDLVYPIIDWPFALTSVSLAALVKDLISTGVLVAGIISRPMTIVFQRAEATEGGAAFFHATVPVVGPHLDKFFSWAAESHYQKTTWWRIVLGAPAAIVLAPLVLKVLVTHPYTMSAGGIATYQSKSDHPRDAMTFDTIMFDGRLVLLLQVGTIVLLVWAYTAIVLMIGP